jgi:hypothetical protein
MESLEIKWLVSTAFYVLLCIIIFIINVTVVTLVAGTEDLVAFHQQIFCSEETGIHKPKKYA